MLFRSNTQIMGKILLRQLISLPLLINSIRSHNIFIICFVNSQGQELFRLSDGESLVQNAPNGERNVSTCHYLDAESAMIDGKKWNLLEFAKEMEKRGIMLAPMELCRVPERG